MSSPVIYVDRSDIREGKLGDLKAAIRELADFVERHVPRSLAYGIYLNDAETQMTVVQIHPDSASLEFHMEVGAGVFARFRDLISLVAIDVYGETSDALRRRLREKARMLGSGTVTVHERQAGFSRLPAVAATASALREEEGRPE